MNIVNQFDELMRLLDGEENDMAEAFRDDLEFLLEDYKELCALQDFPEEDE